jgi:hypothetical protein
VTGPIHATGVAAHVRPEAPRQRIDRTWRRDSHEVERTGGDHRAKSDLSVESGRFGDRHDVDVRAKAREAGSNTSRAPSAGMSMRALRCRCVRPSRPPALGSRSGIASRASLLLGGVAGRRANGASLHARCDAGRLHGVGQMLHGVDVGQEDPLVLMQLRDGAGSGAMSSV